MLVKGLLDHGLGHYKIINDLNCKKFKVKIWASSDEIELQIKRSFCCLIKFT